VNAYEIFSADRQATIYDPSTNRRTLRGVMLKAGLAQSFFKRHILAIGHNFNHHIDVFRAPNF